MNKISQLQDQLEKERKLVSFDAYDLTVRQLLDMVEEGSVFVPPEYQRQFVWESARQSTLIESIFLGIPIPNIFMATNADATWEVVDGVQRIGSLSHFVGTGELLKLISRPDPLVISDLVKLDAMNGLAYSGLPKSMQLHFLTRPLKVTVLNDKSDLTVRFDLFERLNTGGIKLTEQEIRNCVYRGAFNDDLKALAKQPNFHAVVKLGAAPPGAMYEEMVLRFFAYLDSYQHFDHLVKEFLNTYMVKCKQTSISPEKRTLFNRTMDVIGEALPDGIVRNRSKTPVNVYEAIAVGTALAIRDGKAPYPAKLKALLDDDELRKVTGAGSNQRKHVIRRIEYVRDNV